MKRPSSAEAQRSSNLLSRRKFLATVSLGGLAAASTYRPAAAGSASPVPATAWDRTRALDAVIDDAVGSGRIVGATVLAAKHGEVVYQRVAGFADRETQRRIGQDQVYRLASMTKPVVCVTALALIDRGQLRLEDPVTRWLPNFRPKLIDGREPVITVRHLLTHTAGLTYGFLEAEDGQYHRLGVSDGLDASHLTLDENIQRIVSAHLLFEPGTSWRYSVAIDVLGAVIERVTGWTLPRAVQNIVTSPLNMTSVDFVATEGSGLATPYGDASPHAERMTDPFSLKFGQSAITYSPARALDPTAYPSGGTGLVGSAKDYLRFAEAIRTGGAGIIRPETAVAMTRNAIGDLAVSAAGPGFGWGLGVAVLKDPAAAKSPVNTGAWNWGGVYGTNFWVDPTAGLTIVALTNTAVAGMTGSFPTSLRRAVYAS